jgi:hypothetical protein
LINKKIRQIERACGGVRQNWEWDGILILIPEIFRRCLTGCPFKEGIKGGFRVKSTLVGDVQQGKLLAGGSICNLKEFLKPEHVHIIVKVFPQVFI